MSATSKLSNRTRRLVKERLAARRIEERWRTQIRKRVGVQPVERLAWLVRFAQLQFDKPDLDSLNAELTEFVRGTEKDGPSMMMPGDLNNIVAEIRRLAEYALQAIKQLTLEGGVSVAP